LNELFPGCGPGDTTHTDIGFFPDIMPDKIGLAGTIADSYYGDFLVL
jgi:hypothetical protein